MGVHLWDTIKEIRKKHNLNKKQFAEVLGCSPTLIGYIEKPYSESKRTATVDIIRAIAEKFTNSEEERQKLENQLLIKRARVVLVQEITDDEFISKITSAENDVLPVSIPHTADINNSMPVEFINALKADIKQLKKHGVLTTEINGNLAKIIKGTLRIDADEIKDLAAHYGLSQDKYLVLGGYIPDSIAKLYNNKAFLCFFDNLSRLSDDDISVIGNNIQLLVNTILNLRAEQNKKKPRVSNDQGHSV